MISIIAAVAKNNVIGKRNALPWYLPEDLKRFKKLTTGHTVLMGRKTFESIIAKLGKPLPNRKNAVITRDKNYQAPAGVVLFNDIAVALESLKDEDVYVIGGGEIYKQTIDKANTLFITEVHAEHEGDVVFPSIDPSVWKKVENEPRESFSFAKYVRN